MSHADQLYNQACIIMQSDPQTAYRLLTAAVREDPNHALALYKLGSVTAEMKMTTASIEYLRRATVADPKLLGAIVDYGHRLYQAGRVYDAITACERALMLDGRHPFPFANLSLCYSLLGELDRAVSYAQQSYAYATEMSIESDNPTKMISLAHDAIFDELIYTYPITENQVSTCQLALAFALLYSGRYAEGLKHFEARFPYKYPRFMHYPYKRWSGEDIEHKTLLIEADQGMGDTISFMRFLRCLPKTRYGRIVVVVQPELLRLVSYCVGLELERDDITITPAPNTFMPADYWCPIMSLPVALKMSDKTIAEMKHIAPRTLLSAWHPQAILPSDKLNIGIVWKGNPDNDIDVHRSMSITDLAPLFSLPNARFYSLQVGQDASELHLNGYAGIVNDMSPYIRDVFDTITIINQLDVVVAIESSVAHMAALVDKPVLMPYAFFGGDWRVGRGRTDRKGALWCPRHMIFQRQMTDSSWSDVMSRIRLQLEMSAQQKRS